MNANNGKLINTDDIQIIPIVPSQPTLQQRLQSLERELNTLFLERETLIRLMITGLLAKANGFIGGLPGTGKTALTKAISLAFEGNCFYYLVSRTTVPDEIIGAIEENILFFLNPKFFEYFVYCEYFVYWLF